MKHFLIICALAMSAAIISTSIAAAQPPSHQMVKIKGVVPGCSDSLVGSTGQYMSISSSTIAGVTTYQIYGHGPGNNPDFDIRIKDYDAGSIETGDSIRVTYCKMMMCESYYMVGNHATPTLTVSGNLVSIDYTDCLLPLNGLNGSIHVSFTQP